MAWENKSLEILLKQCSISETFHVTEEIRQLILEEDGNGDTCLMKYAAKGEERNVSLITRCNFGEDFLNHRNKEGKSATDVAFENGFFDIVEHLVKAGASVPRTVLSLTEQQRQILVREDDEGNTRLLKYVAEGDDKCVFLIVRSKLGLKFLNHRNRQNKTAADIAWERGYYNIVMQLLEADADFPVGFDPLSLDAERYKYIIDFVEQRNKLHDKIREGDIHCIEDYLNSNSEIYLNIQSKSAALTAIENEKYEVYAYLKSKGISFKNDRERSCLGRLNKNNLVDIEKAVITYFPRIHNAHIHYLLLNSRLNKNAQLNFRLRDVYERLDKIPEISKIMKVLLYLDSINIIFDCSHLFTSDVTPRCGSENYGITIYENGRIFIGAKVGERELSGTLSHEIAHLAMHVMYENNGNPYCETSSSDIQRFSSIANELRREISSHVDSEIRNIFYQIFEAYEEKDYNSEIIARIVEILALYGEVGRKWISENFSQLYRYFESLLKECELFVFRQYINKPNIRLKVIDKLIGFTDEIRKLNLDINFNDSRLEDFLKSRSPYGVSITNHKYMGCHSIYQWLQDVYQDNFYFFDINSCIKYLSDIIYAFSRENCNLLIICIFDYLNETLFNVLKEFRLVHLRDTRKKIIYIVEEKHSDVFYETQTLVDIYIKNRRNEWGASSSHPMVLGMTDEDPSEIPVRSLSNEVTFRNLSSQSQLMLLQKEKIIFQGSKTSLQELMNSKITLSNTEVDILDKLINPDIIEDLMTNKNIYVGNKIAGIESVYIKRQFNKIEIKSTIEKNEDLRDRLAYSRETFFEYQKMFPNKNIHWLNRDSKKLIWVKSKGSISDLRDYVALDHHVSMYYSETELCKTSEAHDVVIISATAGMGKSTVVTHLSEVLKENYGNHWIINVNLKDHTNLLNEILTREIKEEDYCYNILNLTTCFEKRLFDCHKIHIKIIFDEFDQVCPKYKDIVINFINYLLQKVNQVWITTRPNLKTDLEDAFQTFAFSLNPFSRNKEKELLLIEIWKQKFSNETDKKYVFRGKLLSKLKKYANMLIAALSKLTSIGYKNFLGVPLHLTMVADIFFKNIHAKEIGVSCEEFLSAKKNFKDIKLEKDLNILDLYEEFIKLKFYKYYLHEKNIVDLSKPSEESKLIYKSRIQEYQLLALYTIFRDEISIFCEDLEIIKKSIQRIKTKKENSGIIDGIVNNQPHFIHLTFAEYLATFQVAKKLLSTNSSETVNLILKNIDSILRKTSPVFLKSLINRLNKSKDNIFAKLNRTTLLNYVSQKNLLNFVQQLIAMGYHDWPYSDILKKTALHYAAEYGQSYVLQYLLSFYNDIEEDYIFENGRFKADRYAVSKLVTFVNTEDIHGYTALYYAVTNGFWSIACILLSMGANFNKLNNNYISLILHHISKMVFSFESFKEKSLMNVEELLPTESEMSYGKNLLTKVIEKLVVHSPDIYHMAFNGTDSKTNFYKHILFCFFLLYGRVNAVKNMLSNSTTIDVSNWTFLFTALDVVNTSKYLTDDQRFTLLTLEHQFLLRNYHYTDKKAAYTAILESAAQFGHLKTFKKFIKKDVTNCSLYFASACKFSQFNIIYYLLKNFKKEINSAGQSALHIAISCEANLKVFKYIIENDGYNDLNNSEGRNPIVSAIFRRSEIRILKYLICHAPNCSIIETVSDTRCIININGVKYGCLLEDDTLMIGGKKLSSEENFYEIRFCNSLPFVNEPLLHSLILKRDLEWCKFIIRKGEDINLTNHEGKTPLHLACQTLQIEIVQLLLMKGAIFDAKDKEGKKPIDEMQFQSGSRYFRIQFLLEKINDLFYNNFYISTKWGPYKEHNNPYLYILNARNEKKQTLLHAIVSFNKFKSMKMEAIKRIFNLNSEFLESKYQWQYGKDSKSYKFSEDYEPIQINAVDSDGNTPLHISAFKGYENIAAKLLRNGAIFNLKNNEGKTPEDLASGNLKKVLKIVDHIFKNAYNSEERIKVCYFTKRYLNPKTENQMSLLHISVLTNNERLLLSLFKALEKDLDINVQNDAGRTPLHMAVETKNTKFCKLLLQRGAIFNIKDIEGKTPLDMALSDTDEYHILDYINQLFNTILGPAPDDVIPILESVPGKYPIFFIVNARDKHCNTILHYAAKFGYYNIVCFLLQKGAIFECINRMKETPFSITNRHDIRNLLKSIRKMFAKVNYFYEVRRKYGFKVASNVRDKDGQTLLHVAVVDGNTTIVNDLVKLGSPIDTEDIYYNKAYNYAYKNMKRLLSVRPRRRTSRNNRRIHIKDVNPTLAASKRILEKYLNLNSKNLRKCKVKEKLQNLKSVAKK